MIPGDKFNIFLGRDLMLKVYMSLQGIAADFPHEQGKLKRYESRRLTRAMYGTLNISPFRAHVHV